MKEHHCTFLSALATMNNISITLKKLSDFSPSQPISNTKELYINELIPFG
jgi:hypothetical protein